MSCHMLAVRQYVVAILSLTVNPAVPVRSLGASFAGFIHEGQGGISVAVGIGIFFVAGSWPGAVGSAAVAFTAAVDGSPASRYAIRE